MGISKKIWDYLLKYEQLGLSHNFSPCFVFLLLLLLKNGIVQTKQLMDTVKTTTNQTKRIIVIILCPCLFHPIQNKSSINFFKLHLH